MAYGLASSAGARPQAEIATESVEIDFAEVCLPTLTHWEPVAKTSGDGDQVAGISGAHRLWGAMWSPRQIPRSKGKAY